MLCLPTSFILSARFKEDLLVTQETALVTELYRPCSLSIVVDPSYTCLSSPGSLASIEFPSNMPTQAEHDDQAAIIYSGSGRAGSLFSTYSTCDYVARV